MELESLSWGLAKVVATTKTPRSDTAMEILLGICSRTWPCTGIQSEARDVGVRAKVALGVATWLRYNLAAAV